MFGCRLPGANRRTKWSAKRVESLGSPCLDAGSTPATSTFVYGLLFGRPFFFVCCRCKVVQPAVVLCGMLLTLQASLRHHHTAQASLTLCICLGVAGFYRGCHTSRLMRQPRCMATIVNYRSTPATSTFVYGLLFGRPFFCCVLQMQSGATCGCIVRYAVNPASKLAASAYGTKKTPTANHRSCSLFTRLTICYQRRLQGTRHT